MPMFGRFLLTVFLSTLPFLGPVVGSAPVVDHDYRPVVVKPAMGLGEWFYINHPQAIVEAIGKAEGVSSYGNMYLAAKYGGHNRVPRQAGYKATAQILHETFREWVAAGKPGDFLVYLRDKYAPLGAANDPQGMNSFWLPNVIKYLPEGEVLVAQIEGATIPQ
jgi:hypothetical protein